MNSTSMNKDTITVHAMFPISHHQTHPSQTASRVDNTDTALLDRGRSITRAGCGTTGWRTHNTASTRDCDFNPRASSCWLHILIHRFTQERIHISVPSAVSVNHSWDPVQFCERMEYMSFKIGNILYYRPQSFRKCALQPLTFILLDWPPSFSGKR